MFSAFRKTTYVSHETSLYTEKNQDNVVMLKILQRMTNFDVDSKRFEILKEKVSPINPDINDDLCLRQLVFFFSLL